MAQDNDQIKTARTFTPPGVSAEEAGQRARQIARRLANGEALPGHVLASFEKVDGRFIILASGPIRAGGTRGLKPVATGWATCFIVGDKDCMIGQMLAEPQAVTASSVECALSPFSVNPDPQGLDG